jgi:hypothetical protein
MRLSVLWRAAAFIVGLSIAPAVAKSPVVCAGAALLSGAQLLCSHIDPHQPAQLCTFSWALSTLTNQVQVVSGSFLLPPKSSNYQVYSGAGFAHAMSEPIVLCQGRKVAN